MSVLRLLDTDTASYVIKRRSPELEHRLVSLEPSSVGISVITRAELMYGLQGLPPQHKLHAAVRQFLKVIQTLPWDVDAADFYAEIRHRLRLGGQLIGEMDMMIAAHALAAGAILVTNNIRHFERIPAPLLLENWTS